MKRGPFRLANGPAVSVVAAGQKVRQAAGVTALVATVLAASGASVPAPTIADSTAYAEAKVTNHPRTAGSALTACAR